MQLRFRHSLLSLFLFASSTVTLLAQTATLGNLGVDNFHFDPGTVNVMDLNHPASAAGEVTQATFTWSTFPCAAAATIKFYRPNGTVETLFDQRGPFDVVSKTQIVSLSPAVAVQPGDKIVIRNNTSCGTPTGHSPGTGPGGFFVFPDQNQVNIPVPPPPASVDLLVFASSDTSLQMLSGRFSIDLRATNPRTSAVAVGHVASRQDTSGTFSLPDFTGDPTFPEVTVKMVDATAAGPPFGGKFWFFYSTLTDATIHLVVTDTHAGTSRAYDCAPTDSQHLCSAADTAAFAP